MGQLILATLLGAIAGTMVMLQLGYSSLWSLLVGAPLGALTGFIGENPKTFFASLGNNTVRLVKKTLNASGGVLTAVQDATRETIEEVWFWITLMARILLGLIILSPTVAITALCSQLPYAWFAETPIFTLIGKPGLAAFSTVPFYMVTLAWVLSIYGLRELQKQKQPIAKAIARETLMVVFVGIAAWPIVIGLLIVTLPYATFEIIRLTIIEVASRRRITVAVSIIEGLTLGWLLQNPVIGIVASVALVIMHWSLRDWALHIKNAQPTSTPA